jgi:hypothetical protein
MTDGEAAQMPLYAGGALVGLYLLFRYIDPALVNLLLRAYFCLAGAAAVTATLLPVATAFLGLFCGRASAGAAAPAPASASGAPAGAKKTAALAAAASASAASAAAPVPFPSRVLVTVPAIPQVSDAIAVTPAGLLAFLVASAVLAAYVLTNGHWLANNAIGVAFTVQAIALINVGSYTRAVLLLGGFCLYDIVAVFFSGKLTGGESIMVAVATKVDGPIKLLFPLPQGASTPSGRNHTLLGLGDLLIPGIAMAHLLRFDAYRWEEAARAKAGGNGAAFAHVPGDSVPTPYFNASLLAYTVGLAVTIVVMYTFESAQPALFYLVPAVVGVSALQAVLRGEMKPLLAFKADGGEEGEGEGGEGGKAKKE